MSNYLKIEGGIKNPLKEVGLTQLFKSMKVGESVLLPKSKRSY